MYEDSNVTEVVSVKFKGRGKAYYFDANGITVKPGEDVIVETSKGLEYAQCVYGNHYVSNDKVVPPIRPVVRIATDNDRRVQEINHKRESEALDICREKVAEHGLDMKLVDVECSFEGNKITFYFTSDGRVDFRELVKDLAGVFRSRIELRQIGVRDEAKMLGGIGMCGRPLCCNQFLTEFQPVSTKMAKTQGLSLNPTKISGTCGRLMCCLRYEEEAYESLVKAVPKNGAFVETPAGYGTVIQVNLLRGTVKVKLDGDGEAVIKTYNGDEVAAVPGGRPKNGETPPHVLEVREREPEEPRQEAAPAYDYAEETAEPAAEETDARASSTRPAGRSFTVEAINPKASVSRASPARMAVASSKALWQEGRPRRRSSSSIAGRSSWMREYVWIISSEAAKGITASALRPNRAAVDRHSTGRRRLPPARRL